jgi:hypothetical protein
MVHELLLKRQWLRQLLVRVAASTGAGIRIVEQCEEA